MAAARPVACLGVVCASLERFLSLEPDGAGCQMSRLGRESVMFGSGLLKRVAVLGLSVVASLGVVSSALGSLATDLSPTLAPVVSDGSSTSDVSTTTEKIKGGKQTTIKVITPPTNLVKVA